MLFLLRPRQTWMPYARPRERMQQDAYNRSLQDAYASTRGVAPVAPRLRCNAIPTPSSETLRVSTSAGR